MGPLSLGIHNPTPFLGVEAQPVKVRAEERSGDEGEHRLTLFPTAWLYTLCPPVEAGRPVKLLGFAWRMRVVVLVLSESHFIAVWSRVTRTGYCVWQELAVQNEVGLVDNPLKISWLEGRPQGTGGPRHAGLSQVRNHASQLSLLRV